MSNRRSTGPSFATLAPIASQIRDHPVRIIRGVSQHGAAIRYAALPIRRSSQTWGTRDPCAEDWPMANPEHVAKIQEGVRGWNRWRRAHPQTRPDLSGADLYRCDLAGAQLGAVNLNKA